MKILSLPGSAAVILLLFAATLRGADVTILNGSVALVISTATAGQEPDSDTDQTTQLEWNNRPLLSATKKITVQTNLASPKFALKVQAINISIGNGDPEGEITVSTSSASFITGIIGTDSSVNGTCDLFYTATATASDGIDIETHTITYTIVDE